MPPLRAGAGALQADTPSEKRNPPVARMNLSSQSIFRMPLLWGGLAYVVFSLLVKKGVLANQYIDRYFNSHVVEQITTVLFFVGMAALVIKFIDTIVEWVNLDRISLSPAPQGGQSVEDASSLITEIERLPQAARNSYLGRRLREALEYVHRKGAAENLDEEVRHLADVDYERMQASYALTRIIIWAIPILGFLGTVIGITMAIAKLSPQALETSLPEVTNGLGVAFDTTALALALSIVLMFVKFFIERIEVQLLSTVDQRMSQLLVGRFEEFGTGTDPNTASVRRMAETVVGATETLVERQAELWNATIEAANTRWSEVTGAAGKQLQDALAGALDSGLQQHANALVRGEQAIAGESHRHWDQLGETLIRSSEIVASQQAELVRQGDMLREVVDAMGQVQNLETTLNNNLATLAGAGNFEETVMSLSAAIQLLSARLGHEPPAGTRVELSQGAPSHSAA